jgi:hypothetical protein
MMRKLPRKLLEDTAPDGGLFHIARYIAQQRIKRNLKAIDWGAPFLRAQVRCCSRCHSSSMQMGVSCWALPQQQ